MPSFLTIILLLCTSLTGLAQPRLLEREEGESAKAFVHRSYPDLANNIAAVHPAIEYQWGRPDGHQKIVFFYLVDSYQTAECVVLHHLGDRRYFPQRITEFYGEGFGHTVEAVFFEEIDQEPGKEMLVLMSGDEYTGYWEEEWNAETERMDSVYTEGCCERKWHCRIVKEEEADNELGVLPYYSLITPEGLSLDGWQTAADIRKALKAWQSSR